ncbi:MAG: L,D-transpeptidase family protein [Moritella sp.]|nr:L,D-transpeptidase family protein [Moritella sp.]
MFRLNLKLLSIISALLLLTPAYSQVYSLPEPGSRLIGQRLQHEIKEGDYLHAISQQYNIGLIGLMASNPTVDPFLPLPGTIIELPTSMILPDTEYKGIVINLPELRLYYFPKNTNDVHVFPVGIGREGRKTPQMNSFVKSKIKDPVWIPTKATRDEYLKKYKTVLPQKMAAGERNPLGNYALRLGYGYSNYLIHGTNQNFGIGMRISAGCIRMNPDDIEWLYHNVATNEPVTIINKPVKFAVEPNGHYMLEVHSPLSSESLGDNLNTGEIMDKFQDKDRIDVMAVNKALLLHYGLPMKISI